MHKLFDGVGQHALMDTAATKTAQEIRPKSIHKDSLAAKRTADSYGSTTDFEPARIRPRAAHGHRTDPDSDEHERLLTAAQVKRRFGNASRLFGHTRKVPLSFTTSST